MAAESRLDIVIGSRAELAGFGNTNQALRGLQDQARQVGGELRQALTFAGVGAGVISINGIVTALIEATKGAIDFNSKLEGSKLGIAAVVKQFDATNTMTFEQAMNSAGEAIDLLKAKAVKSPAEFKDLVGAFQGLTGAATGAGISLSNQVDLVVLMSQALAGLGIRSEQILQESRALITGNINEDAMAARILGITRADIEQAKQAGTLFDFLTSKLSAFSEAGERGAGNLDTMLSNVRDVWSQVSADLAEPAFDEMKAGVAEIMAMLNDPSFREGLLPLGETARVVVQQLMELAKWTLENASTLEKIGKAIATVAAVYGAMKLASIVSEMGRMALVHISNAQAIRMETSALAENSAARAANAAAGGLGAAGAIGAGVTAFTVGYATGSAIDESYNPLRGMFGKLFGTYDGTFDSASDERLSKDYQRKYRQELPGFAKQLTAVDSLDAKQSLESSLLGKIDELNQARIDNTGENKRGTLREIDLQIASYDKLLQSVRKISDQDLQRADTNKENTKEIERQKKAAQEFIAGELSQAGAALTKANRERAYNQLDDAGKLDMLKTEEMTLRQGIAARSNGKSVGEMSLNELKAERERLNLAAELQQNLSQQTALSTSIADKKKELADEAQKNALTLERFDLETKIAQARSRGDADAVASLEEQAKKADYIRQLMEAGASQSDAEARASDRVAAERSTSTSSNHQSVDRFTQIGLFTGANTEQLNHARRTADGVQKLVDLVGRLDLNQAVVGN